MGEYIKGYGCAVIGLIGIIIVFVGFAVGGWAFRVGFADVIGRGNAEIQLQSAPYRIQAYDHFFNLCARIQTDEISIDAQQTQLASTTNPNDQDRIRTNIAALQSNRAAGINQYNADALKDYTLGQFRDSNLPYQLSTAAYDGENKTQCAVS